VNSNALFHFLLNPQICGIRPSDRKIVVGKPQDAHLHFDSDSHQQSLCVVLVFGQDERCDWLEDCLSGVPVVRRGTLWGGKLRLHHCRFGLSDFCGETFSTTFL
tara:strand:+ start:349 stop:660 length:312 start_codon:yes stop_codon:yes gene_type:complete